MEAGDVDECEIVSHIIKRAASERKYIKKTKRQTTKNSPPLIYHYLPTTTTGI